jgi:hypothetical protein
MRGLFQLRGPEDLFKKLEYDFARIEQNRTDPFPAFDFFVTARHLPEWFLPGNENGTKRSDLVKENILLQVCENLADGSKHFEVSAPRHRFVATTTSYIGPFDPAVFDAGVFDVGNLFVLLTGEAAAAFGERVAVQNRAEKVLTYWREKLKGSKPDSVTPPNPTS